MRAEAQSTNKLRLFSDSPDLRRYCGSAHVLTRCLYSMHLGEMFITESTDCMNWSYRRCLTRKSTRFGFRHCCCNQTSCIPRLPSKFLTCATQLLLVVPIHSLYVDIYKLRRIILSHVSSFNQYFIIRNLRYVCIEYLASYLYTAAFTVDRLTPNMFFKKLILIRSTSGALWNPHTSHA